jgi:glycosyltransferase involved in cell wall biosynthesis
VRVIVATAVTPFVHGGASLLVDWLEQALVRRGHEVETYRIPVYGDPWDLPAQIVGLRMWDFTGQGDRLIAVRTPSYHVRHHHKVAWFLHHHRPAYDLWETYPDVPSDNGGWELRRMMFASDEVALGECKNVFTNSARVRDRLRHFNGIDAEVLYPPLGESVKLESGSLGDSVVYVSRVVDHKRQLLTVQAMAHTRTPVKLIVGGGSTDTAYTDLIEKEIKDKQLGNKVRFLRGMVSEADKSELLANALAVAYVPFDEDSYGYVGLEAAACQKPLVTTTDSGGVLELVEDGVNGFICEPTPRDVAYAFDALWEDRVKARRMGAALAQRATSLYSDWDHVVDRLLT